MKGMQSCELYFKQVVANLRGLRALIGAILVRDDDKVIAFIRTNSRRLGS